jgi:hypothetical protein
MKSRMGYIVTLILLVGVAGLLQIRASGAATLLSRGLHVASLMPSDEIATLDLRVSLRSGQLKDLEPAYQFLWSHWTARRAARVTVTFYGIDAGVVHTITIRRGSRGVWRIDEHRRFYAARQRTEQASVLVQSARDARRVESADSGFSIELVKPSGGAGRLFAVENWPRQ